MLSNAPIRVNIRSTGVSKHLSAETKHPIYASITARQVYRSKVYLPPMLGPETKSIVGSFPPSELLKDDLPFV